MSRVSHHEPNVLRWQEDDEEDILPEYRSNHAQFPFLDEFVAYNATVHFEAMSHNQFWIGVDLPDGRRFTINCGAASDRAKGYARLEQDQ